VGVFNWGKLQTREFEPIVKYLSMQAKKTSFKKIKNKQNKLSFKNSTFSVLQRPVCHGEPKTSIDLNLKS